MLNVSTLLLYNISKTTTPFVNTAVNEALRQIVPFFHNGLFQMIDSRKFLVMVDLLLKGAPNSINPWGLDPGLVESTLTSNYNPLYNKRTSEALKSRNVCIKHYSLTETCQALFLSLSIHSP